VEEASRPVQGVDHQLVADHLEFVEEEIVLELPYCVTTCMAFAGLCGSTTSSEKSEVSCEPLMCSLHFGHEAG
jgi:hypothetical protein